MSKKNHTPGPVPAGNRPNAGPKYQPKDEEQQPAAGETGGDQEQDPQRRLGDFEGTGEHSRQQPGRLNDGDVHSR